MYIPQNIIQCMGGGGVIYLVPHCAAAWIWLSEGSHSALSEFLGPVLGTAYLNWHWLILSLIIIILIVSQWVGISNALYVASLYHSNYFLMHNATCTVCKCSRFFGKEICFWDIYPILPPNNSFGPFYRLYYSGTFINEHLWRATTRYITAKSSGPDWNYNDFTECKATSQERLPLYIIILHIMSSFIVPFSFSNWK